MENTIGKDLNERMMTETNSGLILLNDTGSARHPAFNMSKGSSMNPNDKYYMRNIERLGHMQSLGDETSVAETASNYYEKSMHSDQEDPAFNLPNLLSDKRF